MLAWDVGLITKHLIFSTAVFSGAVRPARRLSDYLMM